MNSYHLHKVRDSSKMNENYLILARINMLDVTYNSVLNAKLTQGRGYTFKLVHLAEFFF